MDDRMDNIRLRMKNQRKLLGYSFQTLADLTGMTKSTLQRYETGKINNLPLSKLDILSAALHTTPAYLMGWEEEPTAQLDSEPANNFTEEDIQLLEALKALSPRDRSALLAQIAALNALQDKESKPSPNRKDDK